MLIQFLIMNLLALGFLASQEVKDARVGNLGLWDRECQWSGIWLINLVTSGFTERLALHWIQKYIHAFGGDPSKVTM
jgi:acetylcholinesterase